MGEFIATSLPNLISLSVTALIAFIAFKGGIGQKTSEAQQGAISALNTELNVLRNKVTDQDKDSARLQREYEILQHKLDALQTGLEEMGLIVTMRGKMVIIKDSKGGSKGTTIHIEDKEE